MANLNTCSLTRSGKKQTSYIKCMRQHLTRGHICIWYLNRRNAKSSGHYCPKWYVFSCSFWTCSVTGYCHASEQLFNTTLWVQRIQNFAGSVFLSLDIAYNWCPQPRTTSKIFNWHAKFILLVLLETILRYTKSQWRLGRIVIMVPENCSWY